MTEKVNSKSAPEPVGSYPHTRKVGNLLFLSGVGPRKPGTKVIPGVMVDGQGNPLGHDIEVQCHSAFKNVKIIIRESNSNKSFYFNNHKSIKKSILFLSRYFLYSFAI